MNDRKGAEAIEWAIRDMIAGGIGDNVFFGHILSRMHRQYISRRTHEDLSKVVNTAAVTVRGNRYEIIINTDFFDLLEPEGRVAILIHEIMHITHNHLTRMKPQDGYRPRLANIAMDAAINQFIPTIPNTFQVLGRKGDVQVRYPINHEYSIPGSEPNLTAEEYYEQLLKLRKKASKDTLEKMAQYFRDIFGDELDRYDDMTDEEKADLLDRIMETLEESLIDSHDMFQDIDEETNRDILEQSVQKAVLDAFNSLSSKAAGNLSQPLKKHLEGILSPPEVPWRRVLRGWMHKIVDRMRNMSMTREHIFYDGVYPGRSFKTLPNFDFYMDVSGSILDPTYVKFLSEGVGAARSLNAVINVHQFDTEVHHSAVVTSRTKLPDMIRAATGGTNFKCILDHARANGNRNIVIFTDGYAPEEDYSGFHILWVYTKDHQEHDPHRGQRVFLNDV